MEAMDLKTVLLTFRRSFGRRYSDTVVIHVFRHRKSTVRVLPGGEASRGRCSGILFQWATLARSCKGRAGAGLAGERGTGREEVHSRWPVEV